MIFGEMCTRHWPPQGFDIDGLYETQGLTGSESGFFNIVRGLSERGHIVDSFAKTSKAHIGCPKLAGAQVYPLFETTIGNDYDVYFVWNEPDYLRHVPKEPLRVVSQQLNDFTYCQAGYDEFVDIYAMPSEVHRQFLIKNFPTMTASKSCVVPNSINLEFFQPDSPKRPLSVAYCSSPDRGLHRLLEMWPRIRAEVPGAELRVYYRLWPWYETVKGFKVEDHIGRRARYIKEAFLRLGENGENGVFLVGPVPPVLIAQELSKTMVLAYPCDPVSWTEGFSISIMDACAARCMPIISDADALPSIYGGVAEIIPGRPGKMIDEWVRAVSAMLRNDDVRNTATAKAMNFSKDFSRQSISARWEAMFEHGISRKRAAAV